MINAVLVWMAIAFCIIKLLPTTGAGLVLNKYMAEVPARYLARANRFYLLTVILQYWLCLGNPVFADNRFARPTIYVRDACCTLCRFAAGEFSAICNHDNTIAVSCSKVRKSLSSLVAN